MYNSSSEKDVLQCPYNKYHIISSLRFSRHLVKCERNYPNNLKVICPYDATHRVNKNEIKQHIKHCPARVTVEGYFFQLNDEDRNSTKSKEHSLRNDIDATVDPDDSESSLSYALEDVLTLENEKLDKAQDNQSKFKPRVSIKLSSDDEKGEEGKRIHDRRISKHQRTNDNYGDFFDVSLVSREVSLVGRRGAIGQGNISDYSDSLMDESMRGEESLVGLRAIGRGRPIISNAERLTRFRMKGGKTGGRVPKYM